MKTVIVDTEKNEVRVVDIEDNLDNWYKEIHCDIIDIVYRRIGQKYFAIICDDIGLLKENPIISAVSQSDEIMFCGSLAITNKPNSSGELVGLTDDDVKLILGNRGFYLDNKLDVRPVVLCEY